MASTAPQLFIKSSWTLPYTLERLDQALHRAADDPIPATPTLTVCGIGHATSTVCVIHNLIKGENAGKWPDYTVRDLDTQTVSNTERVRTQLSFQLTSTPATAVL